MTNYTKPVNNILIVFISGLLLTSCIPTYPIKGKTAKEISTIRSGKPVDSVWANVISVFTANGFVIKEADKNSGSIVTEKYDLGKHYSFVLNGKPIDTTAWIGLSYIRLKGGFGDNPILVSADWHVTIKPDKTGSIVKINLTDVDASVHIPAKRTFHPDCNFNFMGISTGVFEGKIADAVK